jgi:hypothetical protein
MPTVLRIGPYRLFFYSGDRQEPQHVHVERDGNIAKFWLTSVRLQKNRWLQSYGTGANLPADRRTPREIDRGLE